MHTQSYIDHIRATTAKSRLNRRRANPRRIAPALAALVGVSGILAVAYHLSAK
jgi:hypothetical protein